MLIHEGGERADSLGPSVQGGKESPSRLLAFDDHSFVLLPCSAGDNERPQLADVGVSELLA